jgi:PKD repeat protein
MKTSPTPTALAWCSRLLLSFSIVLALSACGGGSGAATGAAGLPGSDAALLATPVPAGSQCANGGAQVVAGLDANHNGQLDSSEVTAQTTICNAAPGSVGTVGSAGAAGTPGATGAAGGTGATGAAGVAATGATGATGSTGAAGAAGAAGATGAAGLAGAAGSTGAAGPAGASGANATVPTRFNTPPSAHVVFTPNGLSLGVSASTSSDPDGTITSYSWNFGEPSSASNTASGVTATHTFAAAGSYVVTLLATDNQGGPAINQQTVTITTGVPIPVATGKLNDTGITASQCYQAGSDVLVSCTSAAATGLNPAQDGMQGRDVAPATSSSADGKLGFSYTKIGASGETLPASATAWSCVEDNVTGMVWEVKTKDGGLRDWTKTYTHYDSTTSAQVYNFTTGATSNPTQAQIDAVTNSVGFKNAVNAAGLCGANDWRLPTPDELQGLVDYGVAYPGPTIDATWFPNTQGDAYRSSSPYVGSANLAWFVNFREGFFAGLNRLESGYVRLVRAGQ